MQGKTSSFAGTDVDAGGASAPREGNEGEISCIHETMNYPRDLSIFARLAQG